MLQHKQHIEAAETAYHGDYGNDEDGNDILATRRVDTQPAEQEGGQDVNIKTYRYGIGKHQG